METYETKLIREYLGKHTTCEVENLESKSQLLYGIRTAIKLKTAGAFRENVVLDKLVREDCDFFDEICNGLDIVAVVLSCEAFGETTLINASDDFSTEYTQLVLNLIQKSQGRKLTTLEKVEITNFLDWVLNEYGLIAYKNYLDTDKSRYLLDTITTEIDKAKPWEKIRVVYERVNYELTKGE